MRSLISISATVCPMQVITSVAGGRPILMDAEGEQLIAELIIELADKTGKDKLLREAGLRFCQVLIEAI